MNDSDWSDIVTDLADLSERISVRCFAGDESIQVQDRRGTVMLKIFSDCPHELAQSYVEQLKNYVRTP